MALIGMTEAGKRVGMTGRGTKTSLVNASVPMVKLSPRFFAVEEADFEVFLAGRPANYKGRGRPVGSKNK